MPKNVPTPVAAALGIVPTVVDSVRRIPGKAVQLPVLAISTALGALETARKDYTELAERGERVIARVRGGSLDGLEDWAESLVEDTPLAKPYEKVEDLVEDTVDDIVANVTELLDRAATPKPKTKPVPVETAATPEVVQTVEAVVEQSSAAPITSHNDLPLADYDHLTLGSLRGRLRSLSVDELVQVRDYEKAHAHRLPVVTLLDNRIAKLATDAAAAPSPGGGADVVTPPATAPAKVKKAAAPKKSAPKTKVRIT